LNSIIDKVHDNIIEYSMISEGDRVLVGLSGGADSVMLLTALFKLRNTIGFTLAAAHVNHGIRGESADADCLYCAKLCGDLNIPFHSVYYDIPRISAELKTSEENAGRIKRYAYFNELSSKYGYNKIAVAHNMNDSVETVMINMIRGSSLSGICGIRPVNSNIIRPIFNISREEIEYYLSDAKTEYRTDETNLTDDYTRNKIRNKIIKTMSDINPSVVRTIFSNTENFREDEDYIANQAKKTNAVSQNSGDVIVDKCILNSQHIAIKKRILLDAFHTIKGNLNNIEKKHIDILLGDLSSGKTYHMPDGIQVSVSFDKLIFSKGKNKSEYLECKAFFDKKNRFGDNELLLTISDFQKSDDPYSLCIDYNKVCGNLTIRSRKTGDKFTPYGMTGSKKIKQLFSELKIPFNKRYDVPIICDEKEIIAVVPYRINDHYKITENTKRFLNIQLIKEN